MKKSILNTVHDAAQDLHKANLVDFKTMREFDSLCIEEVKELSPKEIKDLRMREEVSQPIFARYINASPSTVKKWETGEKRPMGPSLKLLNLILKNGLFFVA